MTPREFQRAERSIRRFMKNVPTMVPAKLQLEEGDRVAIKRSSHHPWGGEAGTFKGERDLPIGRRLLVALDNGTDCFAKREELQILE